MSTFFRRDDWVTDALGNAISGAGVYVCSQPANTGIIPPSPLVQLYADPNGMTPITQPVQTDGFGHAAYYVAAGTYTVVYYSPQIQEVVLPDQLVSGGSGVSIPVAINQGGTGAITAPLARTNLGAAASAANADITSLSAIPNTTINTSGYVFNGGTAATTTTFAASGWQYGSGSFGTTNGVFVGNQSWTGTGYTGPALVANDTAGHFALVGSTGFFTSGTVQGTFIKSLGDLQIQTGGTLHVNTIESYDPGTTLTILANGITGASSVSVDISGNGVLGQALLGFSSYPTQATVGAAAGLYLPIKVNGVEYVLTLSLPV
jgi:hypothetical protein